MEIFKIMMIILFLITAIIDIFILIQMIKSIIENYKYVESKKQVIIEILHLLPFIIIILIPIINILFIRDYYQDNNQVENRKKTYEMTIEEKYNVLVKTLIDCGYFKNHKEVINFIESGKIMDTLTQDYSRDNQF